MILARVFASFWPKGDYHTTPVDLHWTVAFGDSI
jgi:hypothetical protein